MKQIKFEGAWGKLEAKYCFQRQSWPKYMRQTLVLVWNSALREKFNFNFWAVFATIGKIFIWKERLSTRLYFYENLRSSWYFLISEDPKSSGVRQLVRQLVYTIFNTNNHYSFHLWWKENLLKHQKGSKYYDQYCTSKSEYFTPCIKPVIYIQKQCIRSRYSLKNLRVNLT